MNMRLSRFLPLAAAAAVSLAALAAQADQLADIQKKGELVVGVLGTAEPYSFIDPKTRELVGYEVDLGRELARKLGVKPVFKQLAVAARIPELQQGHVDVLAAALARTPERETQIDFSLPTFITGQKVLVKKGSEVKTLPQLAGQRVVTVKGGTQEANIRKAVPTVEVVTFENAPQAFQALQQGKGAGYVDDEAALIDAIAKLGPAGKNYELLAQNVSTTTVAVGLKKGEPALKTAVDDTLRELEKSGQAEKIFFKWYGPGTRHQFETRPFKFTQDAS
ncbi:amino acid ABC transporter substrate-binding protein [Variovorax sp. UMC13]|nr:amino acid ABC transporter substrate-binding protein [Variovorax sp. UMC13]